MRAITIVIADSKWNRPAWREGNRRATRFPSLFSLGYTFYNIIVTIVSYRVKKDNPDGIKVAER
jgi:hypothetical protein